MVRYLGVEMDNEFLQWTSKMETYRKYTWSVGDINSFTDLGPPIFIKPGWNVEYHFLSLLLISLFYLYLSSVEI